MPDGAERPLRTDASMQSIPLPSMPEIAYVRTYAQVAQIQLRSVLNALTEQNQHNARTQLGSAQLQMSSPRSVASAPPSM